MGSPGSGSSASLHKSDSGRKLDEKSRMLSGDASERVNPESWQAGESNLK